MSSFPNKMVTGFNHNIRHKGRLFHVQTEDSGIENPHVITHLFMGGNILASKKTSYVDIVHDDNVSTLVRKMMQEQQKDMLRNLVRGLYDDVIDQYSSRTWQPGVLDVDEADASRPKVAPGPKNEEKKTSSPSREAAASVPPEVVAAQRMDVKPRPREGGETIFGEDLISERSLGEVILSYLAEEDDDT